MKANQLILSAAGALSVAFSASAQQLPSDSILICRSQQCAAAEYSMTREFLFNKLSQLFEANRGKNILLCEADPVSRVCYNNALEMPISSGLINTTVRIPSAVLVDNKLAKEPLKMTAILDYNVFTKETKPRCQTALSSLSVPFSDKAELVSPGFGCAFTTTGNTVMSLVYDIDYIDFDYGTIGARYTLASSEIMKGGKTGYTLLRFTEKMPEKELSEEEIKLKAMYEGPLDKPVSPRVDLIKKRLANPDVALVKIKHYDDNGKLISEEIQRAVGSDEKSKTPANLPMRREKFEDDKKTADDFYPGDIVVPYMPEVVSPDPVYIEEGIEFNQFYPEQSLPEPVVLTPEEMVYENPAENIVPEQPQKTFVTVEEMVYENPDITEFITLSEKDPAPKASSTQKAPVQDQKPSKIVYEFEDEIVEPIVLTEEEKAEAEIYAAEEPADKVTFEEVEKVIIKRRFENGEKVFEDIETVPVKK